MKKIVSVEKSFCDFCGNDSSGHYKCDECGKDICYNCLKTRAIEYPHAVRFSGSGDGVYCCECDEKLRSQGGNAKHSAYMSIKILRKEEEDFYKRFKRMSEFAEKKLKIILDGESQ